MIKKSKKQKVKEYLLQGNSITGLDFITKFHVTSYRDIIYHLRQAGLAISDVEERHSDGMHKRWFMTAEDIAKYHQAIKAGK